MSKPHMTKAEYWQSVIRAAVAESHRWHERRMRDDPAYRDRQRELERKWGEIFSCRKMVEGDL